MLIGSFNVQNLFERASALSAEAGASGARAVEAQAEINVLLRQPDYEPTGSASSSCSGSSGSRRATRAAASRSCARTAAGS
jgi:hypothetical protein